MMATSSPADTVTLTWDKNPDPVSHYRVHYGDGYRRYQNSFNVAGHETSAVLSVEGDTHFALTAVNSAGMESDFSEEAVYDDPVTVINLFVPPPVMEPVVLKLDHDGTLTITLGDGRVYYQYLIMNEKMEFFRAQIFPE